jgi:hypothetical protein
MRLVVVPAVRRVLPLMNDFTLTRASRWSAISGQDVVGVAHDAQAVTFNPRHY